MSIGPDEIRRAEEAGNYICFTPGGHFKSIETGIVPVPEALQPTAGIFLGGCVEQGMGPISDLFECEAAHVHLDGEYVRWMCFQVPADFYDPETEWLRVHELCHVITLEEHTDAWRDEMRRRGQPIPESYCES